MAISPGACYLLLKQYMQNSNAIGPRPVGEEKHEMSENTPQDTSDAPDRDRLIGLTAEVVSAYVRNNPVSSADLPELIRTVHGKLSALGGAQAEPEAEQKPAVSIKRSVSDQTIVCLECGKGQKTLKRHLGAAHDMTPEEYRSKWRLPYDYPMVAPAYAEKRPPRRGSCPLSA